jgi:maltose O-acetyltransferase
VAGENCWIGTGLTIHGNGTVTMGSCCDIGPDVTFLTGSHELGDANRRAGKGKTFDVTIGNGVWVGARSTVMADVGDGSAVAACACVSKTVGENLLVGGVPAKIIREL